jgi:hypothetical protein
VNTLYIVWFEKHLPQVLILANEDHYRTNAPIKIFMLHSIIKIIGNIKKYAPRKNLYFTALKKICENIILAQGMDKE